MELFNFQEGSIRVRGELLGVARGVHARCHLFAACLLLFDGQG